MKKTWKARLALLSALAVFGLWTLPVRASQATSYTYTLDQKESWTRTQDAYLPDKTITELELETPEDLYIDKDNMLYIADSARARVVKYSIDRARLEGVLTYPELQKPTGICVTENGDIYVADPAAKKVFRFDRDFQLLEAFGKPEAPVFADTKFQPSRISVGNNGEMYIVGEGVYSGIIQLSVTGEFLGYFTVNHTRLSLIQAFQNLIFTRAQLANVVERVPTTFSNIFIDDANLVYTTTMGTDEDGVKKHDTAGGNMFVKQDITSERMTDVWVDEKGIIYTSDAFGYIYIYSGAGELIFKFGSRISDLDVSGLYTRLPSLAVDQNGDIWTVDGDKNYLQSFRPTEYAHMIYEAMGLYERGLYRESMEKWNQVLGLNQMSVLAHNGVGKAYLHGEQYEEAMEHFKVSGDRSYYSQAFWEVRNTWIQKWLPVGASVLLLLWLLSFLARWLDRKHILKQKRQEAAKRILEAPVLGDVLYAVRVARHPVDRYYDIRVKKKGTVLGASILYVVLFIVFMLYQTKKGFIYQTIAVEDMDIKAIVIGFFAIIGLFIICNYLVASIQDGDGTFRQVYMIPAYGSLPVIISLFSITMLSHVLTFNEAFMLDVIFMIGTVWSAVNIFLGLMTVHDYTVRETLVSILITAVFIVIVVIISIIVIVIWEQLWGFIRTLGKELAQNVFYKK